MWRYAIRISRYSSSLHYPALCVGCLKRTPSVWWRLQSRNGWYRTLYKKWVRDNTCLTSNLQSIRLYLTIHRVWCLRGAYIKRVIAKPTFSYLVVCVNRWRSDVVKNISQTDAIYSRWYDYSIVKTSRNKKILRSAVCDWAIASEQTAQVVLAKLTLKHLIKYLRK